MTEAEKEHRKHYPSAVCEIGGEGLWHVWPGIPELDVFGSHGTGLTQTEAWQVAEWYRKQGRLRA